MQIYTILFGLEVLGALIALYLIWKRKKQKQPYCVIGEDCSTVLESKYNKIFWVHNDAMGLLYYLTMIGLLFLLLLGIGPFVWWMIIQQILALTGIIMGVILMYIQWRVLKTWCFWCIVSNINTWIIAAIIIKYF